jgi:asparagine synthase (glutamine-hydrolysing)
MCGIAGYVGLLPGSAGGAALRRMARQLEQRGPDGERIVVHRSVGLVYRQLLAPDRPGPAGTIAPVQSADGRYLLIYDGELYNHAELRAELPASGAPVAGAGGDAELLLAGWQQWGAAVLDLARRTGVRTEPLPARGRAPSRPSPRGGRRPRSR